MSNRPSSPRFSFGARGRSSATLPTSTTVNVGPGCYSSVTVFDGSLITLRSCSRVLADILWEATSVTKDLSTALLHGICFQRQSQSGLHRHTIQHKKTCRGPHQPLNTFARHHIVDLGSHNPHTSLRTSFRSTRWLPHVEQVCAPGLSPPGTRTSSPSPDKYTIPAALGRQVR